MLDRPHKVAQVADFAYSHEVEPLAEPLVQHRLGNKQRLALLPQILRELRETRHRLRLLVLSMPAPQIETLQQNVDLLHKLRRDAEPILRTPLGELQQILAYLSGLVRRLARRLSHRHIDSLQLAETESLVEIALQLRLDGPAPVTLRRRDIHRWPNSLRVNLLPDSGVRRVLQRARPPSAQVGHLLLVPAETLLILRLVFELRFEPPALLALLPVLLERAVNPALRPLRAGDILPLVLAVQLRQRFRLAGAALLRLGAQVGPRLLGILPERQMLQHDLLGELLKILRRHNLLWILSRNSRLCKRSHLLLERPRRSKSPRHLLGGRKAHSRSRGIQIRPVLGNNIRRQLRESRISEPLRKLRRRKPQLGVPPHNLEMLINAGRSNLLTYFRLKPLIRPPPVAPRLLRNLLKNMRLRLVARVAESLLARRLRCGPRIAVEKRKIVILLDGERRPRLLDSPVRREQPVEHPAHIVRQLHVQITQLAVNIRHPVANPAENAFKLDRRGLSLKKISLEAARELLVLLTHPFRLIFLVPAKPVLQHLVIVPRPLRSRGQSRAPRKVVKEKMAELVKHGRSVRVARQSNLNLRQHPLLLILSAHLPLSENNRAARARTGLLQIRPAAVVVDAREHLAYTYLISLRCCARRDLNISEGRASQVGGTFSLRCMAVLDSI